MWAGGCLAKHPPKVALPFFHSGFPSLSTFVSSFLRICFLVILSIIKEPEFKAIQSLWGFEVLGISRADFAFMMPGQTQPLEFRVLIGGSLNYLSHLKGSTDLKIIIFKGRIISLSKCVSDEGSAENPFRRCVDTDSSLRAQLVEKDPLCKVPFCP